LWQIPKAQEDTDDLTLFFALLGSAHVKAAHKRVGHNHVGEIDTWSQFIRALFLPTYRDSRS